MNDKEQLTRLVEDIFATRGDEVHGDTVEAQMILATEAQLADSDSQQRYPAMWHHFRFDPDAEREYRMMMELVQMEAAGELAQPARIPAPPPKDDFGFGQQIRNAVSAVFAGFAPATASALTRGESMGVEPVEIEFADGAFVIEVDVDIAESSPELRDLFCRVMIDDELANQLEAAPILLQTGAGGPILQEESLDELGDATFTNVEPGSYTIHLQLTDQQYTIENVTIP